MANPQIHTVAVELHSQGLTAHRIFRRLRKQFRHAERDTLVRASKLPGAPTGYMPGWATRIGDDHKLHPNGSLLHPVVVKRDPRKL